MKITENRKKVITVFLVCLVLFVILFALVHVDAITGLVSALLTVLAPIILGAAFAYLLNPLLKLFERRVFRRMKSAPANRRLSLLCTYLSALLIVTAFFWLLIPSLIQSLKDLFSRFDEYLTGTADLLNGIITKFSSSERFENYFDAEKLKDGIDRLLFAGGDLFEAAADYLREYGMGLVVGVKNVVLALFISVYILAAKERLGAQARKLATAFFPGKVKQRLGRYVRLADKTFGRFFLGKITDSLMVGVITLILLLIFRIPYPVLIATIICITDIIPVFGPFLGTIPSAFIIFIASPQKALIFVLLILVIQQIDGNIIAPRILGDSTGISSLGVIVAIIVMGEYFGVIGMAVGVPVFAVIIAIATEFINTRLTAAGLPSDTAAYYAEGTAPPCDEKPSGKPRLSAKLRQKLFRRRAHKNKSDTAGDAPDAPPEDHHNKG